MDFVQLVPVEAWPPLPSFDLVLFRDVLVYLEESARRSILERLRERIRPNGFVVLGRSDEELVDEAFEPAGIDGISAYRRL